MPYKDPEKARRRSRAYRKAHRAEAAEKTRLWRLANPDRSRESARSWQERNPEKVRAYSLKWKQKNITQHRESNRNRQRKKRADHPTWRRDQHLRLTYGLTQIAWGALFEQQNRCCAACGNKTAGRTKFGKDACWHTDHNPAYTKGHPKFIRAFYAIGAILQQISVIHPGRCGRSQIIWSATNELRSW
jgi:hypothetical protein